MLKNKLFIGIIIAAVLTAAGIAALKVKSSGADPQADMAVFEVARGPLTISVIQSGTIKAREQIILKCEVEGKTSIISLIPEGTRVQKGDLLVELDASTLLDNKIDQEIKVQNTQAAYVGAVETFAVIENQAKSDIDKARLTLEFAKLDLKKYIDGQYPNDLRKADADITLAEEELTRAGETLKWSKTLYDEKYISQTELQADELNKKKREIDIELAKNNRDLLTKFTYYRFLAQYTSDVNQAEMALERTTRKAKADVVQAQADLKAKEAEYMRQQDKLKKLEDQIVKTKIFAPADGLAIYATSARRGGPGRGSSEPLIEGQQVFERQELIYLPTTASAKAEVDIHESSLEKVRTGLPVIVTVEALLGKRFFGTLARIAPLPDAQSIWMNPDLKVYNSDIYLDANDPDLRTGLSCQAEIIVDRYEDAFYVPVQAVIRVNGEPTVYVVNGNALEPRKVEIGLDNNRMVRIISGLAQGELVSLTPPLKSGSITSEKGPLSSEANTVGTRTDGMDERINKELRQMNNNGNGFNIPKLKVRRRPVEQSSADKDAAPAMGMSEEEKQKMKEKFDSMSPEERREMKKKGKRTGKTRPQADNLN